MKTYQQFADRLSELLGDSQAVRITVPGFMPLSVEDIGPTPEGRRQVSLTHYGEQNGDAMRDPEMIFELFEHPTTALRGVRLITRAEWASKHRDYRSVIDGVPHVLDLDTSTGATVLVPVCIADLYAEPVYFRNDYLGVEQYVYTTDAEGRKTHVHTRLKRELKSFARTWFSNIRAQGFLSRDAHRELLA